MHSHLLGLCYFSGPQQMRFKPSELLTKTTANAIWEIRRRSGLTWESLGKLFGVSRRSIHDWANGAMLSDNNKQNVWDTLRSIRHIDEGNAQATQDRIMSTGEKGASIFRLITERRHDEIMDLPEGAGDSSPPRRRPPSDEERARTAPPPLTSCLGSIPDRPDLLAVNPRIVNVLRVKK